MISMKIKVKLSIEKSHEEVKDECTISELIRLLGESFYERHVKGSGISPPELFPSTMKQDSSKASYLRGWFSKPYKSR